ncbi:MAG: hypothetical protein ACAF41_14035 [Leptolyngbya sp. BL-A-14]
MNFDFETAKTTAIFISAVTGVVGAANALIGIADKLKKGKLTVDINQAEGQLAKVDIEKDDGTYYLGEDIEFTIKLDLAFSAVNYDVYLSEVYLVYKEPFWSLSSQLKYFKVKISYFHNYCYNSLETYRTSKWFKMLGDKTGLRDMKIEKDSVKSLTSYTLINAIIYSEFKLIDINLLAKNNWYLLIKYNNSRQLERKLRLIFHRFGV